MFIKVYYSPIISQMDVIFREDMNKSPEKVEPEEKEGKGAASPPKTREEKLLRWAGMQRAYVANLNKDLEALKEIR
jgi:hypothetical protein